MRIRLSLWREGTMKYRQWEFDPILLCETSVQMLLKYENIVTMLTRKFATWTFERRLLFTVSLQN